MHLWTEYEGRTIAEHYTLGKLLRSEGRNGFFATADKDGHPAVIRLTEAHFDEAELLHRWRQVAEVHQDNLIEIEQVGQTTIEGVPLTYALMEPEDANLGDVLKERPMTTAETMQVAKAVLAALQALHASGLVHEHVEAGNVLAVGETVKLRSDCVRECVPDGEFSTEMTCAELRRKDIHDFGALLLRCLTLETEWSPAHNNLPDPFKRVIPRALDGSWSLEQLGTALDPTLLAPKEPARPAYLTQAVPVGESSTPIAPAIASAATTSSALPAASRPLVPPGVVPRSEGGSTGSVDGESLQQRLPLREDRTDAATETRPRFRAVPAEPTHAPSRAIWIVCGLALLAILLLGWHFFSNSSAKAVSPSRSAPLANTGAAAPSAPVVRESQPEPRPAAPQPATTAQEAGTAGAPGWYVVAFTYNHQGQAAAKAKQLRRTHDSLHPQVFTPTGHAPYFVALGGPLSQAEAETVYRHARRSGLPRDTFVRHY